MADVIKMVQAKLADDLIIAQLRQNETPLTLSADDMVRLKTAGASDNVIRAMMIAPVAGDMTPARPEAAPASRVEESEAEKMLAARVGRNSDGRAKLVSFKKTDGQNAQMAGVALYRLAFQATVEFMEDVKWLVSPLQPALEFKTKAPPKAANSQNFSWDNWFETTQDPGVVVRKGGTAAIAGTLTFEKSEKGWSLSNVEGNVTSGPTRPDNSVTNRGPGAVSQTNAAVPTTSTPSGYPISSGSHVVTKFGVKNETLRVIQVFLDGSDTPITISGGGLYRDQLEVGSTHLLKAVVGGRTFESRFTVPRVMRDLHVSATGIQ